MPRASTFIIPLALSVASTSVAWSQKVDLPECAKPSGKEPVGQFTIALPLPIDRAHSRVVRAFTEVGLPPVDAAGGTNQVEWNSGTTTDVWTDQDKERGILATLSEDDEQDNVTRVTVSAFEQTSTTDTFGRTRTSKKPLTSKNGGYGFKVWCASQTIADSLTVAAERIRARQAGQTADTARKEEPVTE